MENRSYVERAKAWLATGDDVDEEIVESSINRFIDKINALPQSQPCETRKDLEATVNLLLNHLGKPPFESKQASTVSDGAAQGEQNDELSGLIDNSPLVDHWYQATVIPLGQDEKEQAIKQLMDTSLVKSGTMIEGATR